ncbi:hypothetical protein amrb99_51800 [Actinomadura sp. RB99]|uniref:hypothetical protein n=1 Tax=Actinomadura sp. RB99 TaxID=2691577 RepID=UPI00168628FA|nr:hypothetical protein [Actinomadura sp. RB99]MBD2896236.1 hypothetical protein [Actinomadura sp. RB99]
MRTTSTRPTAPSTAGTVEYAERPARQEDAETTHVLDVAETTFALLTRGPAPLSVDGAVLGCGLPARKIPLDELRAILLHPATGHHTRDIVWKELIERARRKGSSWVMGCVGIALPGLKAVVRDRLRRLDNQPGTGTCDVAGEFLTAFYDALLTIDLERPKIAVRLLAQSAKVVERQYRPRARVVPVDPSTLARVAPCSSPSNGTVDELLEAAVRQDVISRVDAEIIAATRLDGVAPAELAERLGTSYDALMKRRRRAEMRLVEAMRGNGLRDDLGYLMSKTGV